MPFGRSSTFPIFLLLAGLLVLSGCGSSEIVVPDTASEDNPFAEATVGTAATLEVVTWNLENFAKNGAETATLVRQAIQGLDVDIVALQEIKSAAYFRQVADGLEGWSGSKANSAYADLDLAFLYKTEGPLTFGSIYEILGDEGWALPRTPYVLECAFDGVPLVIIDNHYKAYADEESEERRRQASLLLEAFVDLNYAGQRVIILGDLNDSLTDPQDDNVFANFLAAPESWRFVDLSIAEGSSTLWSYPSYPSHIDHILVTDELFAACDAPQTEVLVLQLDSYMGSFSKYDEAISDHLPVMLKFVP